MKTFSLIRFSLFILLVTITSWRYYTGETRAKALPPINPTDGIPSIDASKMHGLRNSLNSWLRQQTNGRVIPSVSAGIVFNDSLILHGGKKADLDTRFGIASLTKTFTALLILQLEERGVLELDDPVRNYLPGVVIERNDIGSPPVTIKHLLSHTSGMPDYGPSVIAAINGKRVYLREQRYPAGYHYSYSNRGYVLLKYLIETVTGQPYADNLREGIFLPLGMKSSSGNRSNGTGGIITTLRDLSRYAAMLIQRGRWKDMRIISEASYDTMLSSAIEMPRTRSDYHYSLGWEVMTINSRVDSYYKAGRWYGAASGLHIFPKKGLALIYLCNPPDHLSRRFMAWRGALNGKLRRLLRQITRDPKLCTVWPEVPGGILRSYAGSYINDERGQIITVIFNGKNLSCRQYGVLHPMRTFSSNRFLLGPRRLINFVWKNNRVIGLAARDGYYRLTGDL
jgi:CubicO group peptidase (beta-lactamase class C family)